MLKTRTARRARLSANICLVLSGTTLLTPARTIAQSGQSRALLDERTVARLSGYIRDRANNELVRYALIAVDGDSTRAQSDVDGFYYLNLETGVHRLRVRAIGYAPLDTQVTLTAATTRDLFLVRNAQLTRIDISATREKSDLDPTSPDMSVSRLNLEIVKQAPAALGEVDPLREEGRVGAAFAQNSIVIPNRRRMVPRQQHRFLSARNLRMLTRSVFAS